LSYDIFAFNLEGAPADAVSLLAWFKDQAEWSEPHSYDDASVTTPALGAFYHELITTYPPMNGPDDPDFDNFDENKFTDYSIGYSIVYAAFAWSVAQQARDVFLRLGTNYQVGVCEISENPPVIHRPAALND
jgi:hypothetical protein